MFGRSNELLDRDPNHIRARWWHGLTLTPSVKFGDEFIGESKGILLGDHALKDVRQSLYKSIQINNHENVININPYTFIILCICIDMYIQYRYIQGTDGAVARYTRKLDQGGDPGPEEGKPGSDEAQGGGQAKRERKRKQGPPPSRTGAQAGQVRSLRRFWGWRCCCGIGVPPDEAKRPKQQAARHGVGAPHRALSSQIRFHL